MSDVFVDGLSAKKCLAKHESRASRRRFPRLGLRRGAIDVDGKFPGSFQVGLFKQGYMETSWGSTMKRPKYERPRNPIPVADNHAGTRS